MWRLTLFWMSLWLGGLWSVGTLCADEIVDPVLGLQQRVVEITALVEPAVVSIARVIPSAEVPWPVDFDPFEAILEPDQPGPVPDGFGSGVVLRIEDSRRLYILTNHHVITSRLGRPAAADDKLYVRTIGGHTLPATIHAFDPRSDLAVLVAELTEITSETLGIVPPTLSNGEALHKGDFVLALGNPLGIARDGSCSVAWGLVSNLSRRPAPVPQQDTVNSSTTVHQLGTLVQLDMRLPLGMSGGAVVNLKGELVGLTTSLAAVTDDTAPGGFAIPFDAGIQRVIQTLLKGEEVEYGFLGIDPDDSFTDELQPARPFVKQARCARVSRVSRRSPAALAGVREGDLIYQIAETPIHNRGDLVRVIGLLGPGVEVPLHLFRARTRQFLTVTATLGKWPIYDDQRIMTTHAMYPAWRGLRVDYPTGRFRYLPDSFLSTYPAGVVVTQVAENSPAAQAGVRLGMVILSVGEQVVATPQEFQNAIAGQNAVVAITLGTGDRIQVPNNN